MYGTMGAHIARMAFHKIMFFTNYILDKQIHIQLILITIIINKRNF